ncbi:ribonuclease HII [Sphingomonas nostoxanthinifaciens]|uniref:ribonuclease HII n=1 Tax=Sphingomonas nostoxanthinifaciens TaxID=2872652 RepID=UPI001CC20817|nr:ribonuclease HII [Sphingomonas nostoxanthinifaciens]UAK24952.1 ribonuclease HII [Sphingomonas nostoxanthinifaciens]
MAKPVTRPFARKRASLFPPVIGCDEVGRGALCGPVVVCAVWFDPCALPKGLLGRLDDSKRIDRAEREALYPAIAACARVSFAARSARYIDVYNIRNATLQAMQQAVVRLTLDAPVRIDGIDVPRGLTGDASAVVKGDATVPQIAAASIMAKVLRDRLMTRLGERHVHYRWDSNAGYGTAVHRRAIMDHGHTRHHRRSFGDLFAILSGGGERLVAQAAPDAECLDGLERVVHAE